MLIQIFFLDRRPKSDWKTLFYEKKNISLMNCRYLHIQFQMNEL